MREVKHVDDLLKYPNYAHNKAVIISNAVTVTETGCWEWNRSVSNEGRAVIRILGKIHHTSRVSYVVFKREPVVDLLVCHSCDNVLCVSPDHLWLGTPADNMKDMSDKGRYRDQKGELHNLAKLTEDKVLEIRRLATIGYSQIKLSEMYGVSFQQISRIIKRERWKHI